MPDEEAAELLGFNSIAEYRAWLESNEGADDGRDFTAPYEP